MVFLAFYPQLKRVATSGVPILVPFKVNLISRMSNDRIPERAENRYPPACRKRHGRGRRVGTLGMET